MMLWVVDCDFCVSSILVIGKTIKENIATKTWHFFFLHSIASL